MQTDGIPRGAAKPPEADARPAGVDALIPLEPLLPLNRMDPQAAAALEPGETLLWTGRSAGLGRALRKEMGAERRLETCAAVYFFSCMAATMMASVVAPTSIWDSPLTFLAGLPLLAAVVALISLPTALRESGFVCAITDRRVLRIRRGRFFADHIVNIDPISVTVEERRGGSGDLRFVTRPASYRGGRGNVVVGFWGITNVRVVERLLLAAVVRRHFQSVRGQGAADQVLAGLGAKSMAARTAAICHLLQMDASTLDAAARRTLRVSETVVRALGIVGMWAPTSAAGGRAILQALAESTPTPERRAAKEALRRLGRAGVGSLIEAAGSEDPQAMACHLRGIEPELLADALADVLLAEDPTPGVAVAEAICYSWRLRWRVIEEWTSAPAPALERLGKLLAGGGERTRVWAATALGRLSSGGAAESVRALAVSGDARDFPVAVLRAHLGDPSGGEALLAQLRNGDEDAMAAAGEAIGMLGAAGAPYLDALRAAMLHSGDRQMLPLLGQAIARIEKALRTAPTELESAPAPAGSGSELEAGPDAAGTELTAGPATPDPAQRGQQRAR